MQTLNLALYDIETSVDPFPGGNRLSDEEIGFAVGVVRYVRYVRKPDGQVSRGRLLENVHFGPVPLLDDLLRPWVKAVVGFNARHFDNGVLVAQAVAPDPGVYVTPDASVDYLATVRERVQRFGIPPETVRSLGDLPPEAIDAFLTRVERTHEHSRLIPPGAVGIAAKRADVLAVLNARTFDPHFELAQMTGHPHVAKLDYFREALEVPSFDVDGAHVAGAEIPRLWQEGAIWTVVGKCRNDLDVLEQLLHQAFFGGARAKLLAGRLNTTWRDGGGALHEVDLSVFHAPEHLGDVRYRYHLPTGDWFDKVVGITR